MHTVPVAPTDPVIPSLEAGTGLAKRSVRDSPRRQHTVVDGITCKLADCREERGAAFRLVYRAYTQIGLMNPNEHHMRVTAYHLLPTTDVFVAVDSREVVYTITLVGDGRLGLPLEHVYPGEVASCRQSGVNLAEVSCLASIQDGFSEGRTFQVFSQLVGLMFQSARHNGVGQVLVAVHPRHARFYKRLLGFEQIGGEKSYASVCDNPAVACQHDFARLDETRYHLYDNVYAVTFPQWELDRQSLSREDRDYFAEISTLCDAHVPVAAA